MSLLRLRPTLALVFTGLLFLTPVSSAKADSLLNYWFPSIFGPPDTGPKPQETLIAPFAQNQSGPARSLSKEERIDLASPENIVPITEPHRSNKYIADWAVLTAIDALTFSPDKFQDHLKDLDKDFTPEARQGFLDYLTTSKTLDTMAARHTRMQSYTGTVPTLLNEGNFSGAYRWLYDIPVVTTQLSSNARGYSDKIKPQTYTQNIVVRLQIGRAKTGHAEGMAIERWSVVGTPAP